MWHIKCHLTSSKGKSVYSCFRWLHSKAHCHRERDEVRNYTNGDNGAHFETVYLRRHSWCCSVVHMKSDRTYRSLCTSSGVVSLIQNTSLADGSPLPNSPSSMVNQYRLEEDEEEQKDANTKDIFITVDNPESQVTAIETFIMYRVMTKVRRILNSEVQDVWLSMQPPQFSAHCDPNSYCQSSLVKKCHYSHSRTEILERFIRTFWLFTSCRRSAVAC